ncbi:MAG TPA: hypothetical protein VH371_00750 [Candidatus Limnocylindrales bacterium]
MIRCTKCGTINADTDIFCSKCASFLEWTGVKVEADSHDQPPPDGAPPTETSHATPPPPPPPSLPSPTAPPPSDVSGPFGSAPPPASPVAEPPRPQPGPPPEPPEPAYKFKAAPIAAPAASPPPAVSAPIPAETSASDEPPPIKPTAVPAPTQPPARPPQAVAPDEPQSRKPTLEEPIPRPTTPQRQSLAEEEPIKPGDLICGVCGAGNAPDRRFCRRCGNSLAAATVAVAVRVPWYRRIFGRGQTQAYEAGERPSSMGRTGRSAGWFLKRALVILVLIIIVAPIVGYFAVPSFHDKVNSLIGQGGTSAILLQHPSTNALDKDVNTFWLADQASGQTTVTVNFGQTTELAGLIFNIGAPASDYSTYGRPRQVELTFPGNPTPVMMILDDSPAPQQRCLQQHPSVRTFNVRIVSSYPPSGANQNLVATREIEFIAGSCP